VYDRKSILFTPLIYSVLAPMGKSIFKKDALRGVLKLLFGHFKICEVFESMQMSHR
jgi:hypothetical protein